MFAIVLVATGVDPEPPRLRRRCTRVAGAHAGDPRRPGRQPGVDQEARHERRRVLQRRTPRTRSRTRRGSANFLEIYAASSVIPFALDVHLRADGQGQAPGLRGARGHGRDLARRRRSRCRLRGRTATRSSTRSGVDQTVTVDVSRAATSRARRSASGPPASGDLWRASTTGTSNGSVNSMHDSYTPLGGMMPLVHMKLGEVSPGGVGVGLNGMLVLAILVGVHRRPDGRAHAGVPGQEDPGDRGEARRALHPRDAVRGARRHRRIATFVRSVLERLDLQPGPARVHRGALRVHVGRRTTTARRSPGITANTAVHEHRRSAIAMLIGRFFLIIPTLAIAGVARPQAAGCRRRRARSRPTRRCSSVLVIGVIVIVAAPHVLPVARARSHRRAARHLGGSR